MKREKYNAIVEALEDRDSCLTLAHENEDISYNTLVCIYAQKYQDQMRRTFGWHKRQKKAAEYFVWYKRSAAAAASAPEPHDKSHDTVIAMAEQLNIAPTLLARIILEQYFMIKFEERDSTPLNEKGVPKCSRRVKGCVKETIMEAMRDSPLSAHVSDPGLMEEIKSCVRCDDNYSPLVEKVRATAGKEHEFILYEKLHNMNVPFKVEADLRDLGFSKTPDVYLEEPLMVNGRLINWIESKATFGDDFNHKTNLTEQLWKYVNRWGPGLIIYWFGYIKDLDVYQDEGIVMCSEFPPHNVKTLRRVSVSDESGLTGA